MIQLTELTKEYTGPLGGLVGRRVRALDAVTLEVAPGTALGIVGPNGAGKSTMLRLLLGYLRPTAGDATVGGLPPRVYAERFGVGYVPERPAIPPRWTTRGALHAYVALGRSDRWAERIDHGLRELGLESLADRRVGALSKGNLQRLALAQALLEPRRILILDEPTDGVDPEWTARIREIIARWRAADPERVVLFASHNLDEVERVADRVAVLAEGRVRELLEMRPAATAFPPYRIELAGDLDRMAHLIAEVFPTAVARAADGTPAGTASWEVHAGSLEELNRGLARLLENGAVLRALVPDVPTLEQRFRRTMREGER